LLCGKDKPARYTSSSAGETPINGGLGVLWLAKHHLGKTGQI
jgi:hypothetical protein